MKTILLIMILLLIAIATALSFVDKISNASYLLQVATVVMVLDIWYKIK